MKNLDVIFGRIWPQIKLNSTHSLLQCCFNRLQTTLAVELISSDVRVMSCVYEVVCQRLCHILIYLQTINKIGQSSSYEKQHQHFIIQVKYDLAEKKQQLHLYCCLAQEILELSRPHVHHNSTTATRPQLRAVGRSLCPTDRRGAAARAAP